MEGFAEHVCSKARVKRQGVLRSIMGHEAPDHEAKEKL